MNKDEAIEKVVDAFAYWECDYDTGDDWSKEHEARDMAIEALATEAIPISFIENEKLRVNELVIEAVHHSNYKEADRYAGVITTLEALIFNWRREQDQYHEN